MYCWGAALTIIETSKGTEIYQMRGRVSHESPYWTKKTSRWVHMVRGAADKKANNIQARLLVARNMEKCQTQLNEKKGRSGLSTNRSSTMSNSSIRKMKSSRKPLKPHGKGWKFPCKQPCLARSEEVSTEKLVALLSFARQNTHAPWKPTNR